MALKRWVTPPSPCAIALPMVPASASLWPAATTTPRPASVAMSAGATHSGASVTRVRPVPSEASRSMSPSAGGRSAAASWAPRLAGLRWGPSKWMPSTPGSARSSAARTAATACAISARAPEMKVGRNDVVPRARWAAPIVAMVSALGASLNITPPPPLTCRSMKPAASVPRPSRVMRAAGGIASSATMSRTAPPSSSRARPARNPSGPCSRAPVRASIAGLTGLRRESGSPAAGGMLVSVQGSRNRV